MNDPVTPDSLEMVVPKAVAIALRAGEKLMEIYSSNEDFGVVDKGDGSPLTRADIASHNLVVECLRTLTPDVPVLSEESRSLPYAQRQSWETFWLVDPLDGTKEFVRHIDEFTVNIALIENGHAVLGVVHAPAMKATYFAARGLGAFKQTKAF